ncbi:MAG: hypothetical protein CME26_09065 [Gemmatimonadetes bacterium]|nr:hypothetical protein [Gemmatimonadota bacterium]
MLVNYLRVAFRNIFRHKAYSLLNVLGLAVGMASCILILLYVRFELNYERHHESADRIYRVLREVHLEGVEARFEARTVGPLGPALREYFPEVEHAARFYPRNIWVTSGERGFNQRVLLTDPDILNTLTLPFVEGDRETGLDDPTDILITEEMSEKYFGDEPPIGRTLTVEDPCFGGEYRVSGVLEDIPPNSHLRFDFLMSNVTAHGSLN